ncbi:hypothetical protein MBLNU459_g6895t2 [Dothideomycetes sp. NU459]
MNVILGSLIRKKQIEHYKYSSDRVDKRLANKPSHPDFWTQILSHTNDNDEPKLTLGEMHSNSSVFMVAGTETTATLLRQKLTASFTITSGLTYYLLRNPATMTKLTNEVRTAFPSASEITFDTLRRLPYLTACIEEGLRMYPPVPSGLPRKTLKGGAIICGEWVPEDTRVSVTQWATYRSPANFEDAYSFVPERWMAASEREGEGKEEEGKRFANDNHAAFQPFSTGPRNCIGRNLAYHEMRTLLGLVLWHFDLELDAASERWADQAVYTLWEKRPLWVKLQPVQRDV